MARSWPWSTGHAGSAGARGGARRLVARRRGSAAADTIVVAAADRPRGGAGPAGVPVAPPRVFARALGISLVCHEKEKEKHQCQATACILLSTKQAPDRRIGGRGGETVSWGTQAART